MSLVGNLIRYPIAATRCHILKLKCTKFDFGWGGRGGERRGGQGRAGEGAGRERGGGKENGDRPPTIFGLIVALVSGVQQVWSN